jgi:hypothetical protein
MLRREWYAAVHVPVARGNAHKIVYVGTIERTRNHGNPVVQINAVECKKNENAYAGIAGILADVSKGPRYKVSWDYLFSEHKDDVRWRYGVSTPRATKSYRELTSMV